MESLLQPLDDLFLLYLDNDLVSPRVLSLSAIATVFLLLIFIISRLFRRSSSSSQDAVLIVGHSGSGKTALVSHLLGSTKKTVTSLRESVVDLPVGGKIVPAIDVPGHPRIRPGVVAQCQERAAAVLFLVDSVEFPNEARLVGELFYDILSNPVFRKRKLPILVLCNKADMLTASSISRIQTNLEVEIDKIRKTRVSGPGAQEDDGSEQRQKILQAEHKVFEFRHEKQPILFVQSSVKQGTCNQAGDLSLITKFCATKRLPKSNE